jgi:hypothetical protein
MRPEFLQHFFFSPSPKNEALKEFSATAWNSSREKHNPSLTAE